MSTVSLKECFKQKKVEAQYQQKSWCVERVELTAKKLLCREMDSVMPQPYFKFNSSANLKLNIKDTIMLSSKVLYLTTLRPHFLKN